MEDKSILIFLLNPSTTGGYLFHNKIMYCHVKAGRAFINWSYFYNFSYAQLERITQDIKDNRLTDFYFISKESIFNSKVVLI